MTIGTEIALFFIAQSLIIVGAIVTAYVKTQVAIAKLQVESVHIAETVNGHADNHSKLRDKVDGISRALARLSGQPDDAAVG